MFHLARYVSLCMRLYGKAKARNPLPFHVPRWKETRQTRIRSGRNDRGNDSQLKKALKGGDRLWAQVSGDFQQEEWHHEHIGRKSAEPSADTDWGGDHVIKVRSVSCALLPSAGLNGFNGWFLLVF